MNHTQGRWKVAKAKGMPVIATEENPWFYFIAAADWQEPQEQEANISRIVACVNAFDGIEDPQKMRDTWEAIKHLELDAYEKTKQELEVALEQITLLKNQIYHLRDTAISIVNIHCNKRDTLKWTEQLQTLDLPF